jgi:hypothetical protein
MIAVVSLAASLLLAVMLGQWWAGSDSAVTADQFRQQVLSWRDAAETTVETQGWRTDLLGFQELEQQFPLKHMLVGPNSYQSIDPQLEDARQPMAVYDFSSRRGSAYLFVAQTEYTTPGIVSGAPPSQADQLTAGWSMAAWREGPLLYVLLHKGGPHQYDQLVDRPDAIALNTHKDARLLAHVSRD